MYGWCEQEDCCLFCMVECVVEQTTSQTKRRRAWFRPPAPFVHPARECMWSPAPPHPADFPKTSPSVALSSMHSALPSALAQ